MSNYIMELIQIQAILHSIAYFNANQKINNPKENKKMAVIVKLNGLTIGKTTMTASEIKNAQNSGFTIAKAN